MSDTLRHGIIGCKGIGERHAQAVEAADGVELYACADIVKENATEFGEEWEIKHCFEDHVEMIEACDIDGVSICTPSGTHSDIAVEVADAGAHILTEKPLDVFADQMTAMIDAADENDVTLAGVFQRRTFPSSRRAKTAMEEGELGELVLGDVQVKWHRTPEYYAQAEWRGTREMDGGVLLNQAIHGIDLLQWLAGDIVSVDAHCLTLERDIDVEDTAVMTVEFESGAYGTIEASTLTYPQQPVVLELNGQEGSLELTDDELTSFETTDGVVEFEHDGHDEWWEAHGKIVQDFVDAIREDREPMVPGRDARKAVDVILAAYESSERGEPVDPAEIRE